jgi:flagellum-specific peptidoglycan hydrolase FlgJ
MTSEQLQRLSEAAKAAVLAEHQTKCPALLTVAQWALESGWGQHQPGNNPFGIKTYPACFGRQQLMTTEYINGQRRSIPQWFATFATLFDAFEKHGQLIAENSRYHEAFERYAESGDVTKLAEDIAPVYATDPHYAGLIKQIMNMQAVQQSVNQAKDSRN